MADIIFYINCVVFTHFLTFTTLLRFNKRATKSIKSLSLVLLTPQISMILGALKFSSYKEAIPDVFFVEITFYILAAILYYLYVANFLDVKIKPVIKSLHAFLPAIYLLIGTTIFIATPNLYVKIVNIRNSFSERFEYDVVMAFVCVLVYGILTLLLIRSQKRKSKQTGNYKKLHFRWIEIFTWFNVVFSLVTILSEITSQYLEFCIYTYVVVYILFIVSISVVLIKNLPDFLFSKNEQLSEPDHANESLLCYSDIIAEAINTNRIHLEKDLNLHTFASAVDMQPYVLSEYVKKVYNKNFNQFINSHRIEEAKNLLVADNTKKITIEAIGELSGFNSRSTFYSSFKNTTGMTPVEYRKRQTVRVK